MPSDGQKSPAALLTRATKGTNFHCPPVMEFLPRRLRRDESDAMAARIRNGYGERGWGFWAVEVKGTAGAGSPFIGFAGHSIPSCHAHFTPRVEIGWRLAKEHRVSATPLRQLPRAFVLLSRS